MTRIVDSMEFSSPAQAAGYLAAMIDGEGCVTCAIRPSGNIRRSIRIANTDRGVIDATLAACEILGLRPTVHSGDQTNKPSWVVHIGGNQMKAVSQMLSLASAGKQERLERAAAHVSKKHSRYRDIVGRYTATPPVH